MKRRPLPRHDSIKSILAPRFFGTNLDDPKNIQHIKQAPEFVLNLVMVIENYRPPKKKASESYNPLAQPGIYRTVGNMKNVQKLRLLIDDHYDNPNKYIRALMQESDLNVLTSLLKLFLSELETPIVPKDLLKMKNGTSAHILNRLGGVKQKIMEILIVQKFVKLEIYENLKFLTRLL